MTALWLWKFYKGSVAFMTVGMGGINLASPLFVKDYKKKYFQYDKHPFEFAFLGIMKGIWLGITFPAQYVRLFTNWNKMCILGYAYFKVEKDVQYSVCWNVHHVVSKDGHKFYIQPEWVAAKDEP
jgi:hypothetical protein